MSASFSNGSSTTAPDEALRIGLVNAVYEQPELMDAAMQMAENICANAPLAVAYAKQCINEEYDLNADDAVRFYCAERTARTE